MARNGSESETYYEDKQDKHNHGQVEEKYDGEDDGERHRREEGKAN